MKRKVLVNGQEIDISEVIESQLNPGHRILKRNLSGETTVDASKEEVQEELDKVLVFLELTLRTQLRERRFGAGGYRFYE